MADRVTVLTPTCDRPVAFALCERWMAAQTRQPDEWIVADGGMGRVEPTRGQRHLHQPGPAGARNFTDNLRRGLEAVTGDVVIFAEDDDHYAPTHIERLLTQLGRTGVAIAGDDRQRYYHLPSRRYRIMQNVGASLCQTGLRREGFPWLQRAIAEAERAGRYSVDASLWEQAPPWAQSLERSDTVVGLKGFPGRPGLGIGHRPGGPGWIRDREATVLRHWLGPDVGVVLRAMTVPVLSETRREVIQA